jgi:anti-anti-sigma factor
MAVHALTEVEVAAGQGRAAWGLAKRLAREMAGQPGFRALRVFRSAGSSGGLLALSEWESWEAFTTIQATEPVGRLLDALQAICPRWQQRRLEPLFQLELPRRGLTAALAQGLQVQAHLLAEATLRQKAFGLKAMALPGTIGVLGGRCQQDARFFFCAVEFESEAARLQFLESPAWHEWTREGRATLWQKEPRLEVRAGAFLGGSPATEQRSEELGSLSVRIESSPDGKTVLVRLRGALDDTAGHRFERVSEALAAGGCRALTLDVSDLLAASPAGVKTLVAAARRVKGAGGEFHLVDHQGRYDQILRVWQLNQALAEPTAPRRRRPLRLPSPGKA